MVTEHTDPVEVFRRLLDEMPNRAGAESGIDLLLARMGERRGRLLRRMALPHYISVDVMCVLEPDLDLSRAKTLFEEFSRLSFLNVSDGELLMHDEVRAYLLDGWLTEPQRSEFSRLSAGLVEFYQSQAESGSGLERNRYQREGIYHAVGADPEAGFAQFEQVFRQQRHRHALSECGFLLWVVREFEALLSPEQRLWLQYHDGKLLVDLYRYSEAERKFKAILEQAELPAVLEILTLYRLGLVNSERHNWPLAINYLQRGMDSEAFEGVDRKIAHRILDALGTALRESKAVNEAEAVLKRSLILAEELADNEALARSYNSFGLLHRKRNDIAPAIEAFERSLACLENDGGEHFRFAQVYNNLGLALADRNDWEKSEEFLRRSVAIEREAGDTRRQATALANLFRVYVSQGKLYEAFDAADNAVHLSLQIHDWYSAAVTKRSKARVLRRQDRIDEARQELTEAAALFEKAKLDADQRAVEEERERLGLKIKFPWYIRAILGLSILFGVLVVSATVIGIIVALLG